MKPDYTGWDDVDVKAADPSAATATGADYTGWDDAPVPSAASPVQNQVAPTADYTGWDDAPAPTPEPSVPIPAPSTSPVDPRSPVEAGAPAMSDKRLLYLPEDERTMWEQALAKEPVALEAANAIAQDEFGLPAFVGNIGAYATDAVLGGLLSKGVFKPRADDEPAGEVVKDNLHNSLNTIAEVGTAIATLPSILSAAPIQNATREARKKFDNTVNGILGKGAGKPKPASFLGVGVDESGMPYASSAPSEIEPSKVVLNAVEARDANGNVTFDDAALEPLLSGLSEDDRMSALLKIGSALKDYERDAPTIETYGDYYLDAAKAVITGAGNDLSLLFEHPWISLKTNAARTLFNVSIVGDGVAGVLGGVEKAAVKVGAPRVAAAAGAVAKPAYQARMAMSPLKAAKTVYHAIVDNIPSGMSLTNSVVDIGDAAKAVAKARATAARAKIAEAKQVADNVIRTARAERDAALVAADDAGYVRAVNKMEAAKATMEDTVTPLTRALRQAERTEKTGKIYGKNKFGLALEQYSRRVFGYIEQHLRDTGAGDVPIIAQLEDASTVTGLTDASQVGAEMFKAMRDKIVEVSDASGVKRSASQLDLLTDATFKSLGRLLQEEPGLIGLAGETADGAAFAAHMRSLAEVAAREGHGKVGAKFADAIRDGLIGPAVIDDMRGGIAAASEDVVKAMNASITEGAKAKLAQRYEHYKAMRDSGLDDQHIAIKILEDPDVWGIKTEADVYAAMQEARLKWDADPLPEAHVRSMEPVNVNQPEVMIKYFADEVAKKHGHERGEAARVALERATKMLGASKDPAAVMEHMRRTLLRTEKIGGQAIIDTVGVYDALVRGAERGLERLRLDKGDVKFSPTAYYDQLAARLERDVRPVDMVRDVATMEARKAGVMVPEFVTQGAMRYGVGDANVKGVKQTVASRLPEWDKAGLEELQKATLANDKAQAALAEAEGVVREASRAAKAAKPGTPEYTQAKRVLGAAKGRRTQAKARIQETAKQIETAKIDYDTLGAFLNKQVPFVGEIMDIATNGQWNKLWRNKRLTQAIDSGRLKFDYDPLNMARVFEESANIRSMFDGEPGTLGAIYRDKFNEAWLMGRPAVTNPTAASKVGTYLPMESVEHNIDNMTLIKQRIRSVAEGPTTPATLKENEGITASAGKAVEHIVARQLRAIFDLTDDMARERFERSVMAAGQEKGFVFKVDGGAGTVTTSSRAAELFGHGEFRKLTKEQMTGRPVTMELKQIIENPKAFAKKNKMSPADVEARKAELVETDIRSRDQRTGEYSQGPDGDYYYEFKRGNDTYHVREDVAEYMGMGQMFSVKTLEKLYSKTLGSKGWNMYKSAMTVMKPAVLTGNVINNVLTMSITPLGRAALAQMWESTKEARKYNKGKYYVGGKQTNYARNQALGTGGFLEAEVGRDATGVSSALSDALWRKKLDEAGSIFARGFRIGAHHGIGKPVDFMQKLYSGSESVAKAALSTKFVDWAGVYAARLAEEGARVAKATGMTVAEASKAIQDVAVRGPGSPYSAALARHYGTSPMASASNKTHNGLVTSVRRMTASDDEAIRLLTEATASEAGAWRVGNLMGEKNLHNYDHVAGLVKITRGSVLLGGLAWNPFLTWSILQTKLMSNIGWRTPLPFMIASNLHETNETMWAAYNGVVTPQAYRQHLRTLDSRSRVMGVPTHVRRSPDRTAMTGGVAFGRTGVERFSPTSSFMPEQQKLLPRDKPFTPGFAVFGEGPLVDIVVRSQKLKALGGYGSFTDQLAELIAKYTPVVHEASKIAQAARKMPVGRYGRRSSVASEVAGAFVPIREDETTLHMQAERMVSELNVLRGYFSAQQKRAMSAAAIALASGNDGPMRQELRNAGPDRMAMVREAIMNMASKLRKEKPVPPPVATTPQAQ